jgi:hypothetical protein
MPLTIKADPYGYLLQFENDNVDVHLKNGHHIFGSVEIVDDDDTFDRAEPSLFIKTSNGFTQAFSGDIKDVRVQQ